MTKRSEFRPNLEIFRVKKTDPGWIYLVENQDLLKVGKTNNPARRLEREARTWLPDLTIVGVKPFWNVSWVERQIHVALSRYWYSREWYKICDKDDHDFVVNGFLEFYDEDRDMNSVDFIYWMNSSGLAEFCLERSIQKLTLPKFQKQESEVRRNTSRNDKRS